MGGAASWPPELVDVGPHGWVETASLSGTPRGGVGSCHPWVQAPASRGGVGPWGSQGEQGGKACEWWGWEDGLGVSV